MCDQRLSNHPIKPMENGPQRTLYWAAPLSDKPYKDPRVWTPIPIYKMQKKAVQSSEYHKSLGKTIRKESKKNQLHPIDAFNGLGSSSATP